MYSNGTLHMDKQRQDDQLEPTYISSVPIQDVALKQWTIEKSGEKESGISVRMVWLDDDDDDAKKSISAIKCSNKKFCSIPMKSAVLIFSEITNTLFIIFIMFLMFWHEKDKKYGIIPANLPHVHMEGTIYQPLCSGRIWHKVSF